MTMEQATFTAGGEQPRFGPIEDDLKADAMFKVTTQSSSDPDRDDSSSHVSPLPPQPSTEASSMPAHKKKGTASTVKKAPKRPKHSIPKSVKRARASPSFNGPRGGTSDGEGDGEPGADESDNGPYCLCRGADDHRWMICCETCEDWFHGECINLNKEIGESLIEKFVCPNCTSDTLTTLYKKTCALGGCKRSSRLSKGEESVFCSDEHTHMWWERMLAKLPKTRSKGGFNDQLIQEEIMALLSSGLSGVDEEGLWRVVSTPFSNAAIKGGDKDDSGRFLSMEACACMLLICIVDNNDEFLSEEEKEFLGNAAAARFHLAEETLLCHKMLTLLDLANDRRQQALVSNNPKDAICGYDQRLDTISARDSFAAFVKSSDGEVIFETSALGDPLGEDDKIRGMCDRKRCKLHPEWFKMLSLGVKYQIREMAAQADEIGEEEKLVREAARERWSRKKSEKNWVEILDG